MVDKQKNKGKALVVKKIAEKYGLTYIADELDHFTAANDSYKAHILLIGGYSAGKSALLNKYIGKSVLKENQGPETDIAAELHFSEKERIVAKLLDGSEKEILSSDEADIDKTRYLEYYLDSENIKMQCDYIMVDTPGCDSGIEKHNKALLQYVDCGTAFILVVDCEKGTISESILRFVNEITNYSTDIAVIINKCDKKIDEDVQEIKEHVEDLLSAAAGRTFPVICTSIYDEDAAEKIKELAACFEPQYLYDKNITSELNRICSAAVSALEMIKENETCDTAEIEEEISRREDVRHRLLEQAELQKKRIGHKLRTEVKERILSNIHSRLMCSAETLAEAYKGGVEMFQERVVEIIRPIMISEVENYSSYACEDLVKHLNYSSLNESGGMDEIGGIIESIYGKLKEFNADGSLTVPAVYKTDRQELADGSLKTYRAVSSILAIITDIVAPPLELLIVFLPDIVKLLGAIAGTTKERQLTETVQNEIIPQITAKLRGSLDRTLAEVETVMTESISGSIEEILNIENNALEAALNKKKETEEAYSQFIASIENDIENIRKQV